MSDTVDTETMKVSEAAEPVSSPKDNTTKSEVLDQSQNGRDEHSSSTNSNLQCYPEEQNDTSVGDLQEREEEKGTAGRERASHLRCLGLIRITAKWSWEQRIKLTRIAPSQMCLAFVSAESLCVFEKGVLQCNRSDSICSVGINSCLQETEFNLRLYAAKGIFILFQRINPANPLFCNSNTRLKLVRSLAVCEESCPCPIPEPSAAPQPFEKEEKATKDQAEKDDSCIKVEKPEKTQRKMLSRDSSQDYTDSTGIDLHEFLVNTLKGNPRTQKRKFPPMTSYHRMLLHRVAAYFGMDHNVDPSGKSVVINKTTNTRIPDQKFSEHIKDDRVDDFQKRYILKRDNSSFDREDSTQAVTLISDMLVRVGQSGVPDIAAKEVSISLHVCVVCPCQIRMRLKADKRSKSMEEREEEYQRARERIFAHDVRAVCVGGVRDWELPLPVSGSSRSSIPNTPLINPATDTRGTGHPEMIKSVPPQPPPATDTTNYYVFPLEASGIPPGSVLVNPHTVHMMLVYVSYEFNFKGKPFIHPDGSAVVYNPASIFPTAGRTPQQGKTPQQPLSGTSQQQPTNHLHSQPDALNTQFSHMTLTQQPPSESGASDARHFPTVYHHHPSTVVMQGAPPQQVAGYVVAGPSGGHPGMLQSQPVPLPTPGPNPSYPSANPGPAAFPGSTLNQPLLQQHTYIQQPVQQMSTCYCSSAQHPHCSSQQQHYRPHVNPLPYNCPQNQNLPQQQVHQAVMPNQASSYQTVVGVQQTPNLTLTGNQQSNMGNQMQGMMVQYPPMQSYQVSVPQQTYQQPVFVSCQPGQGAVAVAGMQPCYSLLPPNQHTTMRGSRPATNTQALNTSVATGQWSSLCPKTTPRAACPHLRHLLPRQASRPPSRASHQASHPSRLWPTTRTTTIRRSIHPYATMDKGPLGVWRGGHGRKASRKSLSSDLSVGEAVSNQILEVTDPPEGFSCTDSHHLLAELCKGGKLIQRLSDHQPQLCNTTRDAPGRDLASSFSIFAMLPSRYAAPSTALHHGSPQATFKLRTSTRHKAELCDLDKSGS
ncbi:R3H domain-containing protein 1 [Channa argus]|uniref:R3H domain-containing protein 1 n=1 Tax=Channa argus TaxID=215402 RepID=A0A6G1QU72_CHAAH|nr:R3H domain-containing protein 1 [Channa argus]